MLTRRQGWSHFLFQMVMCCFFKKLYHQILIILTIITVIIISVIVIAINIVTIIFTASSSAAAAVLSSSSSSSSSKIVKANFGSKVLSMWIKSLIITEYILTNHNLDKGDFQTLHAKMMQNLLVYVTKQ